MTEEEFRETSDEYFAMIIYFYCSFPLSSVGEWVRGEVVLMLGAKVLPYRQLFIINY